MSGVLRYMKMSVPPLNTQVLLWRGEWLIGMVFISKKGKRLFSNGGFPVGPKTRWIALPDIESKLPYREPTQ